MSSRPRPALPVRHPDLPFDASIPHHWLAGNPLVTHLFNGLNLVFPDGERFFIQAVRDQLGGVQDPELRRQARGFFGQEGRHAHEHERYFEILEAQGYRVKGFLRRFHRYVAFMERWMPAPLRLAVTAGAEHYTATFGAFALEDELLDAAHPTLRKLILWHATEEIEHKAVAFDVLQATHPGYLLRLAGFVVATLSLFGWAAVGTRMLVRQDLAAGRVDRADLERARAEVRARRRSDVGPRLRRAVLAYLRRDFHPGDTDELPLAHRRLAELGMA